MILSDEEILHLYDLSKLKRPTSAQEMEEVKKQLNSIVALFDVLKNIDTDDVAVTAQTKDYHALRKDEVKASLIQSDILANAPQVAADGFAVPAMFEEA